MTPARALRHTLTITRRNLIGMSRSPELVVFLVIQPIMFVMLFRYVFGGSIDIPGFSYVNFLVPGIALQTVAFAGATTSIGITEDLAKGIIDRFRSLPIARSAVLTGRIVTDLLRITLSVAVITIVGFLVGFRIESGILPALAALALAVAFGVAFAWVGAWIGLQMRSTEAVQSVGLIWLFPLTFVSSAFADPSAMPSWLRAVADVNPVTITADALRALLFAQPAATLVWQSLAWIAGITAVFSFLSVRQYRRMS